MATATPNISKDNGPEQGAHSDPILQQPTRQIFQNFVLVWLDSNLDGSNENFKEYLEQLHQITVFIANFTNVEECIDFISEITQEKVFLIVSGLLGQPLISHTHIHTWTQLESIYIFSPDHSTNENWTCTISKIKGLYTNIEPICEALRTSFETCDRATIPMSFCGIDPLFMYTQFLKEAFLEIQDDDKKSIEEFVEYFRLQDVSKKTIEKIEKEYRDHKPIWWYTGDFFICSVLNYGLRLMDTDIILKMGFFIRHLHNDIQDLYKQQQPRDTRVNGPFQVYRGQGLSLEKFDKMKKTNGNFMSFNTFLSTSRDREVSLQYAQSGALQIDSVGILFVITIDPTICSEFSIPFADVKDVGYYGGREEESIFTTHTIFRIDKIQRLQDASTDTVWEVHLTLVSNENHELKSLVSYLRREFNKMTGWSRLGYILIKLGESSKAKHFYKMLLRNASTDRDQALCENQLGNAYTNLGEYSSALLFFNRCLEKCKMASPPQLHALANTYTCLSRLYSQMGEYSKALSSCQSSLDIMKRALPPNHPDLAALYNNIAHTFYQMGKYSEALLSFEQSLEIMKIALPRTHPDIAQCYSNIGNVYLHIGEYSKALFSFERSLDISMLALPPKHPDFAILYCNIAHTYCQMGKYPEALLSFEQSLDIMKIALPRTHPDIAQCYSNIGKVHILMGENSKALFSLEKSLAIMKIALPPNHSCLGTLYSYFTNVYIQMGEYSKALSSCQKSLGIMEIALPPNHSYLATLYNCFANVYIQMGEYSKALSSCQKSLEIMKIALPQNHPNFAAIYSCFGYVHFQMDEYSKALLSFEQSLEILKVALPPNHPNLATLYVNIGTMHLKMGKYAKALLLCERSLEVMKRTLPRNHPDLAALYNTIANVHQQTGEYSKALLSFEQSLEILKVALPPNHPNLATLYVNIGTVLSEMGEYRTALPYFEKGEQIWISRLPLTHPIIKDVKRSINSIRKILG